MQFIQQVLVLSLWERNGLIAQLALRIRSNFNLTLILTSCLSIIEAVVCLVEGFVSFQLLWQLGDGVACGSILCLRESTAVHWHAILVIVEVSVE